MASPRASTISMKGLAFDPRRAQAIPKAMENATSPRTLVPLINSLDISQVVKSVSDTINKCFINEKQKTKT